jgi:hypothetical protein
MRMNMRWIAVVLVVVIIALAYFAFVGVETKAPDIGAQTDPVNPDNPRVQLAYSIININCEIGNPILIGKWWGEVKSISVSTHAWTPAGTDELSINKKLDPLGLLSSDTECWITLKITGPSNYIPKTFTSDHIKVTVPRTDLKDVDFGPYTAKFWDAGTYTVAVNFYRLAGDTSQLLASGSQSFTVSGGLSEI